MAGKAVVRARSRGGKRGGSDRADIELRLAKAMAHPVRVKILELMNERPIAPVEASEEIGTALSNVAYHFRCLLELECIEAVGKQQVRGSLKTTYRSRTNLMFDDLCFATLPPGSRTELSVAILKALHRRASDAFEADSFDSRDDRHLSVTTVKMRWEAWEEITKLMESTLNRVLEIKAEEENREDDAEGVPVTVGLLAFESPRVYE